MKILWVNPSFLDYRVPVYKKIHELAEGNFSLIYSKKRVPERVINKIETAIGEDAIGLENEAVLHMPGQADFSNMEINIPYQPGLNKAIASVDADVIIGEGFFQWTPIALWKARLKRKKFLIAYERTAHTERNCPRWRKLYRKIISKFVDGYLANGLLTKEYLLQLGVSEKKIFIGGMSADSENLAKEINSCTNEEKDNLKTQLSIKKDGKTFLYVGQITERKGVIYLLNAWRKHIEKYPNDSLLAIGTGPLYDKYSKEFSDCASIKLTGNVDYDLIYRYYAIADVFIIPTLEDNWSLVVPEAMACGLPIACSVYNGCYPELVHEGVNGKLFDPLKEESIVETLKYFHDRDLEPMKKASIAIEKKYSSDIVAQNIFNSCRAFNKN
ncbi:MAG: glycosyltransferase family 4 protein [Chitinophagaceae bacterium]